MSIQTIGLLSPGDRGNVVAKVLQSHRLCVLTCLKGRSERTRMLAQVIEGLAAHLQESQAPRLSS